MARTSNGAGGGTRRSYLTPQEVAGLLMVSPVTVRQWAQRGLLRAELTPGGHRRFLLDEIERFASERGLSLHWPAAESRRVLVVDDDELLASYLSALLEAGGAGVEVSTARDGFDAGHKVHNFQPDVLLLDLMMPGLDGFGVCRRLKADPHTRAIRIIAMTGYHTPENAQRILAEGAEACLAKPFSAEELFTQLGPGYGAVPGMGGDDAGLAAPTVTG